MNKNNNAIARRDKSFRFTTPLGPASSRLTVSDCPSSGNNPETIVSLRSENASQPIVTDSFLGFGAAANCCAQVR